MATASSDSADDVVEISSHRLLIAATMLEEFADRFKTIPAAESFAELAQKISQEFWDTAGL